MKVMKAIKIEPLTEEEKSEVREYFKNSSNLNELNSRIWFNYGRMRAF
jgi:hypothetical protein